MQYESPVMREVGSVRELTLQNLFQGLWDQRGLLRGDPKDPVGS
jgi:hypothetical protein